MISPDRDRTHWRYDHEGYRSDMIRYGVVRAGWCVVGAALVVALLIMFMAAMP